LIRRESMRDALSSFVQEKPVMGTCAGAILLGNQIDDDRVQCFEVMDLSTRRNAYGRQVDSFTTDLSISGMGGNAFHAVFIRAPRIESAGKDVEVLASHGDDAVLARQGHLLAATFHPELSDDTRVHEYFVEMIRNHYA